MQYIDQSVDVSVAMQTLVTFSQTVQKSADAPQNQFAGKVVMDAPVVLPRQAQTFQTGQETAEVSQTQHLNRVADVPVAIQQQIPRVLQKEHRDTRDEQRRGSSHCSDELDSHLARRRTKFDHAELASEEVHHRL